MTEIQKCLVCFNLLQKNESFYHFHCGKKLFDSDLFPTLLVTKKEIENLTSQFLNKRLAIPGVQKKLSLNFLSTKSNEKRLTIIGILGGQFILKPPVNEYPLMPELECLTMQLAALCEIKIAYCGLIPFEKSEFAYLIKRFDRLQNKKLACEDLCQLSELLTEQKYKSTSERAAKIIKKYSSFPGDDLLRFFDLILFCFLSGNADMHLKNFSLLTDSNGFTRLSPAYDLISTRMLISHREDKEELALSVNGKKSNLKRIDFEILSENMGITKKTYSFIREKYISKKNEILELIDKSFISEKMKTEFKKLISERLLRI